MVAELKPNQRLFLLTLMALGGTALNKDAVAIVDLKGADRALLHSRGLVHKGPRRDRTFELELTDKGWAAARAEFSAQPPATSAGRTLYALLARLGAFMDARALSAADLFGAAPETGPAPEPGGEPSADAAIKTAYGALVTRPQGWVRLSALRKALPDLDRSTLDAALIGLLRARRISLEPVVDQKTLTEDDRAAGIPVGASIAHHFAFLD